MKKILKYDLPAEVGPVTLSIPGNPSILFVGVQQDYPRLWVAVDESAKPMEHTYLLVGTGQYVPENAGAYIGSAVTLGGRQVLHVYEKAAD